MLQVLNLMMTGRKNVAFSNRSLASLLVLMSVFDECVDEDIGE